MKELIIKALNDYSFLGLNKGDIIRLVYNKTTSYYHSGSCTWSPKQIREEISIGLWEAVDTKVFQNFN